MNVEKFNKYKLKNIKLLQSGGSVDPYVFFKTHEKLYRNNFIDELLLRKYHATKSIELSDEMFMDELNRVCELFYNSMKDKSKLKETIVILSFGTGDGCIEAYYANYLKHVKKHKNVILLALEINSKEFQKNYSYDVYNFDEIYKDSKLFNHYKGILYLNDPDELGKIRLEWSHNFFQGDEKAINIMYKQFDIDIFLAIRPNSERYLDHVNGEVFRGLIEMTKSLVGNSVDGEDFDRHRQRMININKFEKMINDKLYDFYEYKKTLQYLFYIMIGIKKMKNSDGVAMTNFGYIQQYNDIPMFKIMWKTHTIEEMNTLPHLNTLNNCLYFFNVIDGTQSIEKQTEEFDEFLIKQEFDEYKISLTK